MKTEVKKDRRRSGDASDAALRRLVKMPETAHQIYELAESLYLRRENSDAARMTLADIKRIGEWAR